MADEKNEAIVLADGAAEFKDGKIHGNNEAAEDDTKKHHNHRFH
jgi:hypothetical protein